MPSSRVSRRQAKNIQILELLANYARNNPDQRFGQILRNCGAIEEVCDQKGVPEYWKNEFNVEPGKILKRMRGMKHE